jgi:hypothetical protein
MAGCAGCPVVHHLAPGETLDHTKTSLCVLANAAVAANLIRPLVTAVAGHPSL